MADMVKESIDMTAGLIALGLVALPVGAATYYSIWGDQMYQDWNDDGSAEFIGPGALETIGEFIPVVLLAGIIFLAFAKFR